MCTAPAVACAAATAARGTLAHAFRKSITCTRLHPQAHIYPIHPPPAYTRRRRLAGAAARGVPRARRGRRRRRGAPAGGRLPAGGAVPHLGAARLPRLPAAPRGGRGEPAVCCPQGMAAPAGVPSAACSRLLPQAAPLRAQPPACVSRRLGRSRSPPTPQVPVTAANLRAYLDAVVEATLGAGVAAQVRRGAGAALPSPPAGRPARGACSRGWRGAQTAAQSPSRGPSLAARAPAPSRPAGGRVPRGLQRHLPAGRAAGLLRGRDRGDAVRCAAGLVGGGGASWRRPRRGSGKREVGSMLCFAQMEG